MWGWGYVPAAGHIARSGFWHPGSERTCRRNPCQPPEKRVATPEDHRLAHERARSTGAAHPQAARSRSRRRK